MNTKTTPKDFFLHLGATVVLYAAAIALINLSFAVINYAVPDQLAGYFSARSIAWPISMLIVLVPLLYVLEWFIHCDYRLMPEKLTLWIRRWRIYLTLFLAGATIVGDLIALINTYLSGEITMRFVYKILVILVVCGIIFAYYLRDRLNATDTGKNVRFSLAGVGILVVLAAIIGGFIIVGSPAKQRALRFDQQRVNDLSTIQSQVVYSHYQTKGAVPISLSELTDSISGYKVPVDPETKNPYEYTKKDNLSFELCATFVLSTQDLEGRGEFGRGYYGYTTSAIYPDGGLDNNWKHEAGRTCFTRTIDPQKYPVNPKPIPMRAL
jgi:hypothetical protein